MQLLTKKDIINIHAELVRISGEELGILSGSKLDKLLSKYRKTSKLSRRAAILLHDIAHFQAFSEGNKRTAFSSFKVFLEINGIGIKASNEELESVILRSVNNNISLDGVEKWLKERLTPMKRGN